MIIFELSIKHSYVCFENHIYTFDKDSAVLLYTSCWYTAYPIDYRGNGFSFQVERAWSVLVQIF